MENTPFYLVKCYLQEGITEVQSFYILEDATVHTVVAIEAKMLFLKFLH